MATSHKVACPLNLPEVVQAKLYWQYYLLHVALVYTQTTLLLSGPTYTCTVSHPLKHVQGKLLVGEAEVKRARVHVITACQVKMYLLQDFLL